MIQDIKKKMKPFSDLPVENKELIGSYIQLLSDKSVLLRMIKSLCLILEKNRSAQKSYGVVIDNSLNDQIKLSRKEERRLAIMDLRKQELMKTMELNALRSCEKLLDEKIHDMYEELKKRNLVNFLSPVGVKKDSGSVH